MQVMRLELRPAKTNLADGRIIDHPNAFEAWFEDELICTSETPTLDAARELVSRGFDPGIMLEVAHSAKFAHSTEYALGDFDIRAKLGVLAQLVVNDPASGRGGLKFGKWKPHPRAALERHNASNENEPLDSQKAA